MSETHELLKSALDLRYGQSLPGTDWTEEARLLLGVLAIARVKLVAREPTDAMIAAYEKYYGPGERLVKVEGDAWVVGWDAA